jgi:hypothetical protein
VPKYCSVPCSGMTSCELKGATLRARRIQFPSHINSSPGIPSLNQSENASRCRSVNRQSISRTPSRHALDCLFSALIQTTRPSCCYTDHHHVDNDKKEATDRWRRVQALEVNQTNGRNAQFSKSFDGSGFAGPTLCCGLFPSSLSTAFSQFTK